jgi:branched-chain amino acid aminotransferase
MSALTIDHRPAPPTSAADLAAVLAAPGFGTRFSDNMVTATWTPQRGWHEAALRPYAPLSLQPAAAVLHYAQAIFEGLKAYRHADGSVWAFRPEANAERFARSARRLALPTLPVEDFVAAIDALVRADRAWVPGAPETSLYVRPFMFASEEFLGVRPAHEITFCVIASPAGPYFATGVAGVSIWLSTDYTRAAPGGTGAAKAAGNYAASLLAQQQAAEHGCQQVVFLDAVERTWVEELGGMNLFFVHADGSIVTPALTGTILEGITRSSILTLATDEGLTVREQKVSIDDWRDGAASGEITEVFACGTAAVVTPLNRLVWDGGQVTIGSGEPGPVTLRLRQALVDIQYGRVPDRHAWMHPIC